MTIKNTIIIIIIIIVIIKRETNVGHGVCEHTSDNWSHRNSNTRFKDKLGRSNKIYSIYSLKKTALTGISRIRGKYCSLRF
jgi:hypothetical protein